jgi:hypothetical protein
MNRIRAIYVVLVFAMLPGLAHADEWGPWRPFGSTGLSIRFAQVNRTMCTWAFRNDSSRTLSTFDFLIDDINAETGQSEESPDLIPYTLRPGQSVGGWAAFSAEANCGTVRITSKQMQWK